MTKQAVKKRGFSISARRATLDASMKPRRMLATWCEKCDATRHHYDIRVFGLKPGEQEIYPAHIRKVRGICMWCGTSKMFVVALDRLEDSRFAASEMCFCGLPDGHEPPCRPQPNGRRPQV